MRELIEIGIGIARIILGMVALVGGLIVLDITVYIGVTAGTLSEEVTAAYYGGYSEGYTESYTVGYQEAYGGAYHRGYGKGYEIGRGVDSREVAASRVELHNPTHKEMKEFLARDNTDSHPYIEGGYVCFDFAAAVNNNAEREGIRAAYTLIHFQKWSHAVVAFETVDKGLVFIEPQSDREVELSIGESYWQSVGGIRPTLYSDAIVEVQVIW